MCSILVRIENVVSTLAFGFDLDSDRCIGHKVALIYSERVNVDVQRLRDSFLLEQTIVVDWQRLILILFIKGCWRDLTKHSWLEGKLFDRAIFGLVLTRLWLQWFHRARLTVATGASYLWFTDWQDVWVLTSGHCFNSYIKKNVFIVLCYKNI